MSTDRIGRETHNFEGWQRRVALFLSSQSLSLFGSALVQYAIIWHITLTTQSGAMLTIATLAAFLPQIVISLFAGVWADRYSRKMLIMASDALTAVSTLILGVFFALGYQELWLIFVVIGIRSIGAGIQLPAVNAFLPEIVPQDKLIRVNSLNGTIQPIFMIAAPVIAAAMLSVTSLENIFFVDVVTATLAIVLLAVLKSPVQARALAQQATSYFDDLRAGLSYVGQSSTLKTLFVFYGFIFFLIAPVVFLTPLHVAREFGEEIWKLTANEVTWFAGSIIGGFLMTAWGGFKSHFRTLGLASMVWAVLFVGLGLSNVFVLYLVFMFLAGFPMPVWHAASTTLLQEIVEPHMHGRVFGFQQILSTAIMPLGMAFFGPIADVVSIELLLVVSSALLAVPGAWIFFNRGLQQPQPALAPVEQDLFD
ncbi:MAG TPA: MFS transporter [Aggregatilineales bacterium]|jgi:DHA3 family macrolide efflux protein-like MFS transporter|nr:MFS transporter [Chloroflexota bacterium]HOA24349.1 MFS transporter [Aggregatilineales bacterium]HQE19717.1 MFS transporter [Aggregatilineales bacterium]